MADELNVRPKSGIRFPRERPHGGFVGYELAAGEPQDDDYVIPGGPRYRLKAEPERVPSTVYYRRAIARGDLEDADARDEAPESDDDESDPGDPPDDDEREDAPQQRAHESEG